VSSSYENEKSICPLPLAHRELAFSFGCQLKYKSSLYGKPLSCWSLADFQSHFLLWSGSFFSLTTSQVIQSSQVILSLGSCGRTLSRSEVIDH